MKCIGPAIAVAVQANLSTSNVPPTVWDLAAE